MAVRSKRLFGPLVVGTTPSLVYTCPAGKTAILKGLWLWPSSPTVTGIDMFVNGTSGLNHIAHVVTPNSGDIRLTDIFFVLNPGDTLYLSSSVTGTSFIAFGAELVGVA